MRPRQGDCYSRPPYSLWPPYFRLYVKNSAALGGKQVEVYKKLRRLGVFREAGVLAGPENPGKPGGIRRRPLLGSMAPARGIGALRSALAAAMVLARLFFFPTVLLGFMAWRHFYQGARLFEVRCAACHAGFGNTMPACPSGAPGSWLILRFSGISCAIPVCRRGPGAPCPALLRPKSRIPKCGSFTST
jgi:mono/diheme cytochrome c family protein